MKAFMKKIFLMLLTLLITMPIYPSDQSYLANAGTAIQKYGLGDTLCATILFVGGSWLADKQLPRLAGQKIEYDAPLFTKVFSSLLFAVGITGGITGAYVLAKQIRDRLNAIGSDS